jgi:hypothetical protein
MPSFLHAQKVNLEFLKLAWKTSWTFRLTLIFSWLIWLLVLVAPFLRLTPGSEEIKFIPLHYNVFFGVDKFGPWYTVFQLPIFGFFVLLINFFVAVRFFKRERALSLFACVAAFLIQIMLAAAMYFTVLLNM